MRPELIRFFKKPKEKPLFQPETLIKKLLIDEVSSCIDSFKGTVHVNGMTLGKLAGEGEYFIRIQEYRYPRPTLAARQKIDDERFQYMDEVIIKGNKISMTRTTHGNRAPIKSLPISKVNSIIYMVRAVKQFHPVA